MSRVNEHALDVNVGQFLPTVDSLLERERPRRPEFLEVRQKYLDRPSVFFELGYRRHLLNPFTTYGWLIASEILAGRVESLT